MTCDWCRRGATRVLDRHVHLYRGGERDLGPCTDPEPVAGSSKPAADARLMAFLDRKQAASVLHTPRPVTQDVPPPRQEPKERET